MTEGHDRLTRSSIDAVVSRLINELDASPLDSNVRVAVDIGGVTIYRLHGGQLRRCRPVAAGSSAAAPPAGDEAPDDVRISFRDDDAFEDMASRMVHYVEQNALSYAVTMLLHELAMPSLPFWSSDVPAVQVVGTAALAKLLWAACFKRDEQPAPTTSGYDWSKDDLSTGWVYVSHVSPGIKDRVAQFQKDLQSVPVNHDGAPEAQASWMESLINDLYKTAEEWHELAVSTLGPAEVEDDPFYNPDGTPLGTVSTTVNARHVGADHSRCTRNEAQVAGAAAGAARPAQCTVADFF